MSKLNDIGRRNAIPILHTSGSHYEVGFDVGRTFRGLIEDYLSNSPFFKECLLPGYATADGRSAYEATLKTVQENFPQYIRELQGTADGSRIPFHHLMLLHTGALIPMKAKIPISDSVFGCSSIICNHEGQVILGHTEDALPEVLNYLYIVSAHIVVQEPQGRWKTKNEGFTALCYAGILPGFCMGYNHHGLVFSVNIIFPKEIIAGKTPRHFLTRALLAAETMVDAEKILLDKGVGSGDGLSVNLIFSVQEGDHLFHNIEVGPASECSESPMSVLTISPGEHLLHTNVYLRLTNIPENFDIDLESSTARRKRTECFGNIDSRDAVVSLLSDTKNEDYSIYRDGSSSEDKIITVTVGMFDIINRTWTFWMKKPNESAPIVTLPLIFKWNVKKCC